MKYFKYNIEDLRQIFVPWKEPEFAEFLNKQEIRDTILENSTMMYEYGFFEFWNGEEGDSVTMKEMIGAENKELEALDIQVDYKGFQEEITLSSFQKDIENYVARLRANFLKHLDIKLAQAKKDVDALILFRDYLKALYFAHKSLQSPFHKKGVHAIERVIIKAHLESYMETYTHLWDIYGDIYGVLLRKFDLRGREDINSELIDNIERYIKKDKLDLFYQFEVKLVEMEYLNEKRNKWKKKHKSLIEFFLYCRSRDIIKRPFDMAEDNSLLTELEKRYNRNIGTMDKFSKWKKYVDGAPFQFPLLDRI